MWIKKLDIEDLEYNHDLGLWCELAMAYYLEEGHGWGGIPLFDLEDHNHEFNPSGSPWREDEILEDLTSLMVAMTRTAWS